MTERKLSVWVVDPDPIRREALAEVIAAAPDCATFSAAAFSPTAEEGAADEESAPFDVAVAAAEAAPPPLGLGPILALHPAESDPPAWADAALTRPARPAALVAALKDLATKARPTALPGGLIFDPGAKCLRDSRGGAARLTEKEAAAIAYLAAATGPVTRETLLVDVWGYAAGADSHTVETHIHRLRRKLEGLDATARLVTELGGYRLAAGPLEASPSDAMG